MKKKYIIHACLIAGLLSTTACQDFLEENPKSAVTSAAYYETAAQAQENINSMYRMGAPVRYGNAPSAYHGPTAGTNTFLTGYFENSYEGQELATMYSRLLTRQQNIRTVSNYVNSSWNDSYRVINIANGAIKHIPEIEMDENTKSKLIAEAKFFRAFNYFYLVKTFGNIPMPVEPYETLENLEMEQSAPAAVYALIEEDLNAAVATLPASMFTSNGYRITKYVAAMALANVYLQQSKFAEAASAVRIVTGSAHKLADNDNLAAGSAFNKLRTTDNLAETIYSYEFDGTISSSGAWPTYAFSSSATAIFGTYSIFERVYGPTDRFLNVYEDDDLRIQPNQFFHWDYTNPDSGEEWSSEVAGIWYFYDEDAILNTGRGTKDWNIYRYAEALLIAAEAIAESEGVTPEAAGYLAEIKARADMNGKTVAQYTTELQGLSKQAFVEEVWTERLRELPLEFKMWDDCVRTGMFPVISTSVEGQVTYTPLIGAQNGAGAVFKESDLLWPISIDEIQRNPKLEQNPGYPRE